MADTPPAPASPRVIPTIPATTSNNIIVPAASPVTSSSADDYTSIKLAIGWIIGLIVAAKFLLDAVQSFIGFLEKKKGFDKEKLGPFEQRVAALEEKSSRFRSVEQLDKDNTSIREDMTHLKRNLQQQINNLSERQRVGESEHNDLNLRVERLSGKIDNCLDQNQILVKTVERIDAKLDDHFSKITELLMARHNVKS